MPHAINESEESARHGRGAEPAKRTRSFYLAMAFAVSGVVFLGFARSYYLRGFFFREPLGPLLRFHGFVFTSWFLLLIAQAALVAKRRVDLHRLLGMAGMAWAALMVVVGLVVAIHAAQARLDAPDRARLMFLAVPLRDILVFALLAAIGFYYRYKPEIHKRLLLLATINILPPATARLPFAFMRATGIPGSFALADSALLFCCAYDIAVRKRVHPATLWGGIAIVSSQLLCLAVRHTVAWIAFARWLTNV